MRKLISWSFLVTVLIISLVVFPGKAWAQSGTVTDDGFVSTSPGTQRLDLQGHGISLIVAGQNATVFGVHVGVTGTYIKFQLPSSLPSGVTAANVAKATLKLFVSPGLAPSGTIDIHAITGTWSESTLDTGAPAISPTAVVAGVPVGSANSFLVVDVTQLVQQWVDGSAKGGLDNNGIALVASTNTTYVVFDSKESFIRTSGPQGSQGQQGNPGAAATVQVGMTTTVPAGTPAAVLNGGTPNAAQLNFLIPQGPTGLTGPQGSQGPVGATGAVGAAGAVGPLGPQGPTGPVGATGSIGPVGPLGPQGFTGAQGRKAFPGFPDQSEPPVRRVRQDRKAPRGSTIAERGTFPRTTA